MFNKGGLTKTDHVNVRQILANEHFIAVSAIVDNTAKDEDGMCYAGMPLAGNLAHRDGGANAFIKASVSGPTKGVYTVQITTAFADDEVITIGGVAYTKKATESVASKHFAGANAAAQVTSLLKMVVLADYDVAAVDGATDKIGFTQKIADEETAAPTVTKTATTGAIGSVTEVTEPVTGLSDVSCILLHDIEFEGTADANATVLIHGAIQLGKLDSVTAAIYNSTIHIATLAAHGIYVI